MFKEFFLEHSSIKKLQESITSKTNGPSASRPQLPYDLFSTVQKLFVTETTQLRECPEILQFFTNVTTLSILEWELHTFNTTHDIINYIGHFGTTVTTVEIVKCYADSEALIFSISLFPHIERLQVDMKH